MHRLDLARALIGQNPCFIRVSLTTLEKCRKHSPAARFFLHFPSVPKCPSCLMTVWYTAYASLFVLSNPFAHWNPFREQFVFFANWAQARKQAANKASENISVTMAPMR